MFKMSKRKFDLISGNSIGTCVTNWSLCLICQSKKKENLVCPANSNKKDNTYAGYESLSKRSY